METNTYFWIILILLLISIGLIVWLLALGSRAGTPEKSKLDESCSQNSDCNCGLVCSHGLCKVVAGETCSINSECAAGLVCQNGVCREEGGELNEECPCAKGYTCEKHRCKVVIGECCSSDHDCASGICQEGICVVGSLDLVAESAFEVCDSSDTKCTEHYYSEDSYETYKRDKRHKKHKKENPYKKQDKKKDKKKTTYSSYSFSRNKKKNDGFHQKSDSSSEEYFETGTFSDRLKKSLSSQSSLSSYKITSFSDSNGVVF